MKALSTLSVRTEKFDPATSDDPVARKTSWRKVPGGASFRTHKLARIREGRLEFRQTLGARLFYLLFVVLGAGLLFAVPAGAILSGELDWDLGSVWVLALPMIVGAFFIFLGTLFYRRSNTPIVFDRHMGYFWKGRSAPDAAGAQRKPDAIASLQDIHALQLLSEQVSGQEGTYRSYELHIVLKDAKREFVVDHGDANRLRKDAQFLAEFLNVPVWDAI